MPKRRIGLQKDVSSIFKTVPLSADDQVATLRRMPILDPPRYAAAAPQQTEIPKESATPACAGAKLAPDPALAGLSSPPQQEGAAVEPQPETSAKPEPAVAEPLASARFSEKPSSAEPQAGGDTEPVSGGSVPKAFAGEKRKAAATIKAPRHAKGGMLKSLRQMKAKLFASKPRLISTKQKAMVVLVPALAIVLVFVLTQVVRSPSRSAARNKQKASATTADLGGEVNWKVPAPYPARLRDPTQARTPPRAQAKPQVPQPLEPEPEKLIVRSILHTQDRSSAVVGTQIVHEGDVTLGTTIVRIYRDKVEFEKGGKTWTQKIEN